MKFIDEFFESDPVIDITAPKTFTIAAIAAVLFGVMIGVGYHMVFYQIPDLNATVKFQIFVITLLAGFGAGIAPAIIKHIYQVETAGE